MSRRGLFVVLLLALVLPAPSAALQLRWANGADTLSFATATRCVLVLEVESGESALPAEWRLLWLADSAGITFAAADSLDACDLADTARVAVYAPPVTAADSAAHLLTAEFCSDEGPAARRATFVLDQPGGSRGRLKVVALDPADPESLTVIESNEATYNGGVEGEYAPVLLHARSTHLTATLSVTAIGSGLASVETIRIGAQDNVWSLPLTATQQNQHSLAATAQVLVPLPQSVVQVGTALAASDQALLPADDVVVAVPASAGTDTILYVDPDPTVFPKDFAFHHNTVYDPTDPAHPWKGIFHLFYIRAIRGGGPDSIIAHAWTDSLGKPWSFDAAALRPSGVGWDKTKVWAPSIQQVGNLTYMFYTGVDSLGNQSIGYVTTEALGTMLDPFKDRPRTQVYTAANTGWAHADGIVQFRDPFVVPDPDVEMYPGRYLLFNAGRDADYPDAPIDTLYTIGVARNDLGTLNTWRDLSNYEATAHDKLAVPGTLESPLVVRDSLTGAWRMFVTNGNYDPLGYESQIFLTQTVGDSLTDTRASSWPQRDTLYSYTGQDADFIAWAACEHLQVGQVHFFAAYEGNGIAITRMHWDPVAQKFVFVYPEITAVGSGTERETVRFFLVDYRPGARVVRFALESEAAVAPEVSVYDVMGRRVRRLTDGTAMHGRRELTWDCRTESGHVVPTGVYFALLRAPGTSRVIRVPIVR